MLSPRVTITPLVDKIKTQCVPCDTCCVYAHSVTRSGVGFFCPVGLALQDGFAVIRRCLLVQIRCLPSYARRHVTAVRAWYAVRCKPYLLVRGTPFANCPGWMSNHVPSRGDECRLSARLHSRLVKDSPPAQGWSIARLDSLCDVPG